MPPRILSEDEYNTLRDSVVKAAPNDLSEADFNRYIGPAMEQALGQAENTPKAPEGSALERFASGAWSVLNPMPLVNALPIPQALGGTGVIEGPKQAAKGMLAAMIDQAHKAKQAAALGRYSEAVGHAAGAIPVVGPVVAHIGETIGGDDAHAPDIAGGLGQAAGLAAPFVASDVLKARAVNPVKADMLDRAANEQVAGKVLAPGNPKYKGIAAKIAPEVLARKLTGGREELQQAAVEGMAEAGSRLDDAIQSDYGGGKGARGQFSLLPVIGKLQQRIMDLSDSKGVPLSAQAASRINALKDRITQLQGLSKSGAAGFEDLRKIRDESYRIADEARGYERMGNPAMSDEGWAARETGSAIRQTFANRSPNAAKANADYAFWKNLNDVLDPVLGRPKNLTPSMGVTGGSRVQGAIIGQLSHVPGGAFIGSVLLPWLQQRYALPEWNLADAASKRMLAEGLRRGDPGMMKTAMFRIEQFGKLQEPQETPAPAGAQP